MLRELSSAARQAYADVRESIIGLRALPGPQRHIEEVLREYLVRWQEMSGVSTSLTFDSSIALRASHELQLVRIVQEALTNVRKHAHATHATVILHRDGHDLVATIADNGQGFNAAAPARSTQFPQFGIATMRERAESIGGTLTVESTPGTGSTVRLRLPLHDPEA